MGIRDALSTAPDPTEVVPDAGWFSVSWVAFTAFGVTALLAVVATIGLQSGATTVVRTLGVVAALGGAGVHYVGVGQLFRYEDSAAADAGATRALRRLRPPPRRRGRRPPKGLTSPVGIGPVPDGR